MEEKFQEESASDNSVEYNSLVSACRKAYPEIPAREATRRAQTMWTKLKERYVMGMLLISNLNFDKYSTQMDNMCIFL